MNTPSSSVATFLAGARTTTQHFNQIYRVTNRLTGAEVGGIEIILGRLLDLVDESLEELPIATVAPYHPGDSISWGGRTQVNRLHLRIEREVELRLQSARRAWFRRWWRRSFLSRFLYWLGE